MSSKTKTNATKEEARPALVPKLRFPEFLGTGNWEQKHIEDFFNVGSSKRVLQQDWVAQGIPFYRTRELVSLSKNEPFSSEIFISKPLFEEIIQKHGAPREGDFLISGVGTLGISYLVKKGDEFYFKDGNVILFSRKGGISSLFFKYCFESDVIQNQILKQASVSTVGTYTIQNAKITKFYCPPTEAEQQKIADCLSSVDELMAAQSRKVNAIKTHKKGLMLQLFPRKGETQPRLRFPEFQNAGEWKRMALGQAAIFYNGRAYKQEELLESGKYPVLRVGNFFTSNAWYYSDLELDETKYCEKGDLLYAWSASFGPRIWRGEKSIYHYHIWKVIEQRGIDKQFLFITLENETENMKAKTTNGLGIMHITKGAIESWQSAFPTLVEQRKIADCLTSLDNTIAAEIEKLDTLKSYKEGLMQQLFPSPDAIQS